jgi:hypothetical protein
MSEVISERDAAALKEQDAATVRDQRLREDFFTKEWRAASVIFENVNAAAAYLNRDPKQGPGEAMSTVRDDGTVVVFAYY